MHAHSQGEDQKKLDVISNDVFKNCLASSGRTGVIASEEEEMPIAVEETYSGETGRAWHPFMHRMQAGIVYIMQGHGCAQMRTHLVVRACLFA